MKFLYNLNYQILVYLQLASEPLIKPKMRTIARNVVCYRELHQIPCLELVYHHSTPDLVLTLKGIHIIYCTCVNMYTVHSYCTCTCTFILYLYSSFIQCTCVHVHVIIFVHRYYTYHYHELNIYYYLKWLVSQ